MMSKLINTFGVEIKIERPTSAGAKLTVTEASPELLLQVELHRLQPQLRRQGALLFVQPRGVSPLPNLFFNLVYPAKRAGVRTARASWR
jgi:hypothetical protein